MMCWGFQSEGLRKKLANLQHQLEARFESEAEVRESSLSAELDDKRTELEDAKMKQAELMAALSRKDRDIQSIAAQKRDALAALENVPAGERSLGGGAATLATLERLKDLQEKVLGGSDGLDCVAAACCSTALLDELTYIVTLLQLDKAEDVAATATRQVENQAKAAELERQGLQAEVLRATLCLHASLRPPWSGRPRTLSLSPPFSPEWFCVATADYQLGSADQQPPERCRQAPGRSFQGGWGFLPHTLVCD